MHIDEFYTITSNTPSQQYIVCTPLTRSKSVSEALCLPTFISSRFLEGQYTELYTVALRVRQVGATWSLKRVH